MLLRPMLLQGSRKAILSAAVAVLVLFVLVVVRSAPISEVATPDVPASGITVYFMPHLECRVLHGGAALRMCAATGACKIVPNFLAAKERAGAFTRGNDNFAIPLLTDGEISIGQGIAMAVYTGEKLGFSAQMAGRGGSAKGVQFMLDIKQMLDDALDDKLGTSKTAVYTGLALPGDGSDSNPWNQRYNQLLVYLEGACVGPFFFGASPTYVDYYLVSVFQYLHEALKEKTDYGPSFPGGMLTDYPKVHGVLKALVDGNGYAGQDDAAFRAALLLP